MSVNLLRMFLREILEDDAEDAIEELMSEPEFNDLDAFSAYKLDNEEFEYDFTELQALARNAAKKRTRNTATTQASQTDVSSVRDVLEKQMGFKYVSRQNIKKIRRGTSHGTHPFAGSGGGGSGFGSDFGGGTFTSFGGGPGAVGGEYDWDANDPKNLSMGSKRKKS